MTDSNFVMPDTLWTGRVFLVHLGIDACEASGRLCGRVQHVRTNDALHFASIDELIRFLYFHAAADELRRSLL